jgi:hypothetical protein
MQIKVGFENISKIFVIPLINSLFNAFLLIFSKPNSAERQTILRAYETCVHFRKIFFS